MTYKPKQENHNPYAKKNNSWETAMQIAITLWYERNFSGNKDIRYDWIMEAAAIIEKMMSSPIIITEITKIINKCMSKLETDTEIPYDESYYMKGKFKNNIK